MKAVKTLIIALIFFAGGFFLGQSYQLPYFKTPLPAAEQVTEAKITLSLQFSETEMMEFQNVTVAANDTVLDVLKKITEENSLTLEIKDYEGLGTLVTKIGEQANGTDNKFWQFFVNGQYAKVGADKYILTPNDDVAWKFTDSQINQ